MDKEKIALENFKQGLNCAQSVFCVFAQEAVRIVEKMVADQKKEPIQADGSD